MNLFSILQMILGLAPIVVKGIENTVTAEKSGATKKQVATTILSSAFTGLATAANLQPSNATLSLVNQLTDVGIETAVAVMNAPAVTLAASSPTPEPVVVAATS